MAVAWLPRLSGVWSQIPVQPHFLLLPCEHPPLLPPSPAISAGLLPQCLPSSADLPLAASHAHVIPCHASRSRV